MKASEYAPTGPLHNEPLIPYTEPGQRREVLLDALRGVTLGTYDLRIVGWAVEFLDNSTLRVLVSWIERARRAGQVDALEALAQHLDAAGSSVSAAIVRGRSHDIRMRRWSPDGSGGGVSP